MTIGKFQKQAFAKWTPRERAEHIRFLEREISVIALSMTRAGERKRAELNERIDYLRKLGIR